MSVQVREAFAWFGVHVLWGLFSAFVLYPFFVSPFGMSYVMRNALPASEAGPIFVAIGLVVALVSYIIMYFAFLALRSAFGAGRSERNLTSEF